jgi:ATP-dependent exoDNAse (exonuclease V) alpha subunit
MDERTGVLHNYERKRGVWHSEIFLPEDAPEWMHDRARLWNAAEQIEKYRTAQPARMLEVALPVELTQEQNLALIREFVQTSFVAYGMVADVSMHYDNTHNPHVHILLSMRCIDNRETLGFCRVKERAWNKTSLLLIWREAWATHVNRHLTHGGYTEEVDHRSYQAQGVTTIPTIHLGRAYYAKKYRDVTLDRLEIHQAIETTNTDRLSAAQMSGVGLFTLRGREAEASQEVPRHRTRALV